ncbi:Rv3235 family protein [Solwaraspora sp. WMMD406]|uniref:Rv3235 family protein n=1 Tax=Solwaraspora sp. WMMD406 TaxID=3016095 RepID=UPI002417C4B9|nr:Rv3235 family protein [Solwaraspora sp. WMMD406]MDG4763943.1 Rv3235 family protein [Solwaraspora sp. WMMD406]
MTVPTQLRRPPIRLRAAPPLDPPFTDESAQFGTDLGIQLVLDLSGSRPAGRVDHHRDPSAPTGRPMPPDALAGASPEARRAAHRFLAACVEIINGFRPVGHARRLSRPAEAHLICAELTVGVERARGISRPPGTITSSARPGRGPQPGQGPRSVRGPQPSRGQQPNPHQRRTTSTSGRDRTADLVRVRQLRVCEPVTDVVETAAVLGTASHSWAFAFRLERRAGAWLGTAVQVV